jgi:lipid-binding SYLF domain-containing protein
MKIPAMILCTALAAALAAPPAAAVTRQEQAIQDAMLVLRELQAMPDQQIPDQLLARAEGIVILPANVKFALIGGARFGGGVMLVRTEIASGATRLVKAGGGSTASSGGQVADIILVLTTKRSIEGITDGKMTLGADASVAAGPVGRTAMASTSLNFDSEVYAYSRTKGLFAGVSLEGSGIFINDKYNRSFYDDDRSATAILSATNPPPPPANDLVSEIARLTDGAIQSVASEHAEAKEPARGRWNRVPIQCRMSTWHRAALRPSAGRSGLKIGVIGLGRWAAHRAAHRARRPRDPRLNRTPGRADGLPRNRRSASERRRGLPGRDRPDDPVRRRGGRGGPVRRRPADHGRHARPDSRLPEHDQRRAGAPADRGARGGGPDLRVRTDVRSARCGSRRAPARDNGRSAPGGRADPPGARDARSRAAHRQ